APAAIAIDPAWTFTCSIASAFAGTDAAAISGTRRRGTGNAIRIPDIEKVERAKQRQLRGDNRRLDNQCRIGILRRFRVRRRELFIGATRQNAARSGRRLVFSTATASSCTGRKRN